MSKNELTTFTFAPANAVIRVVTSNGNPRFVAADIYRAIDLPLGSQNYHMARLADDEKGYEKIATPGGEQKVRVVSESGLYKLVMRSDKLEARKFQDWVTREVLPAIRKDGAYVMGEEKIRTGEMDEDTFLLKAFEILKAKTERLKEENLKLTSKVDELSPKADAFDVVSSNAYTIARLARTLDGVNSNATKRDLVRSGHLYRQGSTYRVYSQFRDNLFVEKIDPSYGVIDIFPTEAGKVLITRMYRDGRLTMKKGYKPSRRAR